MSRAETGIRWVHITLVAACASTFSCLLTVWLLRSNPESSPPAFPGAGGSSLVVKELVELREQVVAQLHDLRGQPVEHTERTPVENEGPSQSEEMQALLDRMDQLLSTIRYTASGGESVPLPRHADTSWTSIEGFVQQYDSNIEAATRSVLLMTPAEVIARFGIPTEARPDGGGMVWEYVRFGADGKVELDLILTFASGYVVRVRF